MGRGRGGRTTVNLSSMVKQTQLDMAKAAEALEGANTMRDAMNRLYETFYNRPDDPPFEEWLMMKQEERREVI